MVGVGIAIATAGIIVGAVGSTGLSTNLIIVIESIAKDNVTILLFLTIILCLLLRNGITNNCKLCSRCIINGNSFSRCW